MVSADLPDRELLLSESQSANLPQQGYLQGYMGCLSELLAGHLELGDDAASVGPGASSACRSKRRSFPAPGWRDAGDHTNVFEHAAIARENRCRAEGARTGGGELPRDEAPVQ